ncbi:MAG: protein of unknown function DUF669 [Siphoviridae sp. ctdEk19]|nr:MAG: protein of unknown function DUF669 [Siphoviridae sp. ctdEk19]
MPIFDPQTFLDAQTTDANSTVMEPCPIGEWPAAVADVEIKSGVSQKSGDPWTKLNVKWEIQGTPANEQLDRPVIRVTQGLMLDLTESGGLDAGRGKNVQLGRLREATGLNVPGQPFSFRMLIGRSAKVNVVHREYEGNLYDEVKGIVRQA